MQEVYFDEQILCIKMQPPQSGAQNLATLSIEYDANNAKIRFIRACIITK
jgi:hypothetical protein